MGLEVPLGSFVRKIHRHLTAPETLFAVGAVAMRSGLFHQPTSPAYID